MKNLVDLDIVFVIVTYFKYLNSSANGTIFYRTSISRRTSRARVNSIAFTEVNSVNFVNGSGGST